MARNFGVRVLEDNFGYGADCVKYQNVTLAEAKAIARRTNRYATKMWKKGIDINVSCEVVEYDADYNCWCDYHTEAEMAWMYNNIDNELPFM